MSATVITWVPDPGAPSPVVEELLEAVESLRLYVPPGTNGDFRSSRRDAVDVVEWAASEPSSVHGVLGLQMLEDVSDADPFSTERFMWVDQGLPLLWLGAALNGRWSEPDLEQIGSRAHAFMRRQKGEMTVEGIPRHLLSELGEIDWIRDIVLADVLVASKEVIAGLATDAGAVRSDLLQRQLSLSDAGILTLVRSRRPERFHLEEPPEKSSRAARVGSRVKRTLRRRHAAQGHQPQCAPMQLGGDDLEVHSLVCSADVAQSSWSLATFMRFTGLSPRIVLHDDGTLNDEDRSRYHQLFPDIEILEREGATEQMSELLRPWPKCRQQRLDSAFYCSQKLFDPVFLSGAETVMLIDSDVLFFKRPAKLMELACSTSTPFFSSDYRSAYTAPRRQLEEWSQARIEPCVNAGLINLSVADYKNGMDFLEEYFDFAPSLNVSNPNRHEQTAHAMLLSSGAAERLPDGYQLSGPIGSSTVSFHFVNDGVERQRFWSEGVRLVREQVQDQQQCGES